MKMKSVAALFACFVASSTFAADVAQFEKQLRSDILDILKTRWSAQKVSEAGDAYADKWLLDLKTAYPELLPDEAEPTIPTDPYLRILQDEAAQHRRPQLKGEIWHHYYEKWRDRLLNSDQRILFARFLDVIISEAKRRRPPPDAEIERLEAELRKLKIKAYEERERTSGAVTPRAP
jgi:hypothetical protein